MNRTDDTALLERFWRDAEAALPPGWELDGLRCQSTGLGAAFRSDGWRAIAHGPNGATLEGEGVTPVEALDDLVAELRAEARRTARLPGG